MNKIFFSLLAGLCVMMLVAWLLSLRDNSDTRQSSQMLTDSWRGYKNYFIQEDGEVRRPREGDAISEGQANALLRAVVMGDRKTFDRILKWTEEHLSRKALGDHLLSWHYKNGSVQDKMPATDADIDYALALLLASEKWKNDVY